MELISGSLSKKQFYFGIEKKRKQTIDGCCSPHSLKLLVPPWDFVVFIQLNKICYGVLITIYSYLKTVTLRAQTPFHLNGTKLVYMTHFSTCISVCYICLQNNNHSHKFATEFIILLHDYCSLSEYVYRYMYICIIV